MRYQIRIDNELYESNKHFLDALDLYDTVDETCLKQYIGNEKTLVEIDGDKEKILRIGVIAEIDPMQLRADDCPIDYEEPQNGLLLL